MNITVTALPAVWIFVVWQGVAAVAVVWAAGLHWVTSHAPGTRDAARRAHHRRRANYYVRLAAALVAVGGVFAALIPISGGLPAGTDTTWWWVGAALAAAVGVGTTMWYLGRSVPPQPMSAPTGSAQGDEDDSGQPHALSGASVGVARAANDAVNARLVAADHRSATSRSPVDTGESPAPVDQP